MSEQHVTVKLTLSALPGGGYRSRIEESPAGASRGSGEDFALPAKPQTGYATFLKEVDSGARPATELRTLGKTLYDGVFAGSVEDTFRSARAVANQRKAYLRLAISPLSPELVQVPWEFLHDGDNYLLKQSKTQIVRVLDDLPPQMAPFRPFQKLLLAVANPRGPQRFDPGKHLEKLPAILEEVGASCSLVFPATRAKLMEAIEQQPFDAFYFLGHGQFDESDGGQILLEDKNGDVDPLPAATLAEWFDHAGHRINFAYFNSCSTAVTDEDNSFAGVAQRILADGKVPAVVGQQAPVLAGQSMDVSEAFLRKVRRGASPEIAIDYARTAARNATWGMPVLYTHLRGPEEFERNRLECLFEADQNTRFVLTLPTFCMGLLRKDFIEKHATVTVEPATWYKYAGPTHPLTAIQAAWDVMGLLTKIVSKDQIEMLPADELTYGGATHQIFFGSKSHERVARLLNAQATFRLDFGDEWVLTDTKFDRAYRLPNPSRPDGAYQQHTDYGLIEKIVDVSGKRVFFVIAGLGDRATRGCARYLADNWSEILEDHVQGEFSMVLEFPTPDFAYGRLLDRKTGKPA